VPDVQEAMDRLTSRTYDTAAGGPKTPARSYLICSTPRCGSTLLGADLADAKLGVPAEYFNAVFRQPLATRWGCDESFEPFLRALHVNRTSPSGLFGLKVHWFQLRELRIEMAGGKVEPSNPYRVDAGFLEPVLPNCRFIHVVRRDVVAQAVSLYIAWKTQDWMRAAGEGPEAPVPPYDYGAIDRARRLIESEEVGWDRFFRHNRIDPLVLVYEDFVQDRAGTMRRIAEFVGEPVPSDAQLPREPWLAVQRTEVNREYARQYIEYRDVYGWDHPMIVDVDPYGDLQEELRKVKEQPNSWLRRARRAASREH
jgi:LPS sulfotransferase NodH